MPGDGRGPLDGKVALVTGAGRNTGRAVALALARFGAAVGVNARSNADEAAAVVSEIQALGGSAVASIGDVASQEAVDRMVAHVREALGPIQILICVAAARSIVPFPKLSPAEWRRVVSTTLDGTFLCARAVLGDMISGGFGRLIFFSADGAHTGTQGHAHVAAAKLGVEGMMRSLAPELGPSGITVNVVSPGAIDTTRQTPDAESAAELESRVVEAAARSPLRRLVRVDEVADLCAFLSMPETAAISGQVIHVNGGACSGG